MATPLEQFIAEENNGQSQAVYYFIKKHLISLILFLLQDENRYHQDIFGITLRTAEVHSASRESAKRIRLESINAQP